MTDSQKLETMSIPFHSSSIESTVYQCSRLNGTDAQMTRRIRTTNNSDLPSNRKEITSRMRRDEYVNCRGYWPAIWTILSFYFGINNGGGNMLQVGLSSSTPRQHSLHC